MKCMNSTVSALTKVPNFIDDKHSVLGAKSNISHQILVKLNYQIILCLYNELYYKLVFICGIICLQVCLFFIQGIFKKVSFCFTLNGKRNQAKQSLHLF